MPTCHSCKKRPATCYATTKKQKQICLCDSCADDCIISCESCHDDLDKEYCFDNDLCPTCGKPHTTEL